MGLEEMANKGAHGAGIGGRAVWQQKKGVVEACSRTQRSACCVLKGADGVFHVIRNIPRALSSSVQHRINS
jgi:hypothetical protein